MNETSKTLTFVLIGAAALVLGWYATLPSTSPDAVTAELGKEFFPEFQDVQKVAAAEVVAFDSSTDTKHDLTVKRVDGEWKLNPEKQGYPEVSIDRLSDVSNAVVGLKKLFVVTDDRSKHRDFGVVDPGDPAELKEGTEGVGKRIVLMGDAKNELLKLVVGKADETNKKLHYVRQPGRDRVYKTEVDADRLSSRFEDWVKPDLLGAAGGELRAVEINDHSIDVKNMQQGVAGQGIMLVRKVPVRIERARAEFDKNAENKWIETKFQAYDKDAKTFVDKPLAADEELETSKFSDLQRALAGVKIVDVVKKPKELAADLQAEQNFLTNSKSPVLRDLDAAEALQTAGFFPNVKSGDILELICHEGDMTVGFANGVQYTLRFGDITGKGQGSETADGEQEGEKAGEPKAEDATAEGAAKGSNTAPNRYLLVTATFNQDLIPKPKLTELPPETEPAKTEPPAPGADASGSSKGEDAAKNEEPKNEEQKEGAGNCDDADPAADEPKDEVKPDDAEPQAEPKTPTKVDPETAADEPAPPAAEPKPEMTPEERKRIEAENKRKQEKYEADVKAGAEKAKQLNAQFADWFYVVSDATFQGLNVDPTTLIKKSSPPGAAQPGMNPHQGIPGLEGLNLGLPPQ